MRRASLIAGILFAAAFAMAAMGGPMVRQFKGLYTLASGDFANQGTATQLLHGNAAGNPSWSAVSLTADVSGTLGAANGGVGTTLFSKGSITLTAGSGTAAVGSGATCICTDTTANASVRCAVAGTTLTATGTGTDVIAFHCA